MLGSLSHENAKAATGGLSTAEIDEGIKTLFRVKQVRKGVRLIDLIENGKIPKSAYSRLAARMKMSQAQLAKIINIAVRTINRRAEYLEVDEADKLARVARVLVLATVVLESEQYAIQWLNNPCPALGGREPLLLLHTDTGAREVENLLYQIEYGVYV